MVALLCEPARVPASAKIREVAERLRAVPADEMPVLRAAFESLAADSAVLPWFREMAAAGVRALDGVSAGDTAAETAAVLESTVARELERLRRDEHATEKS